MSAMRTAPRRAPALRPERTPRPDLRVVDPALRPPRRALTRALTVLAGLLAAAGLFVVVCLHVLLTQGQADLDALRTRAEAESAKNRRLRVEVAELESPSRIVSAARERLGMVPPRAVVYVPAADPNRPLPPVSSEPLPTPTTVAPVKATTAAHGQGQAQAKSPSTPTTVRRSTTPTTAGKATPTTTAATGAASSGRGG